MNAPEPYFRLHTGADRSALRVGSPSGHGEARELLTASILGLALMVLLTTWWWYAMR